MTSIILQPELNHLSPQSPIINHPTNVNSITPKIFAKNKNNLLKFVDNNEDNSLSKHGKGKRCFSNNTAVSYDSPQHFRINNTLVVTSQKRKAKDDIELNPQEAQKGPGKQRKRKTMLNKNYFNFSEEKEELTSASCKNKKNPFIKDYNRALQQNPKIFDRVISKYSSFIEQNIYSLWGYQYPLMGFERSPQARLLQNNQRLRMIEHKKNQRQTLINSFHKKDQLLDEDYKSNVKSSRDMLKTLNKKDFKSNNNMLFSYKAKIRSNRNDIAQKLHRDTQSYLVQDKNLHTYPYSTQLSFTSRPVTTQNEINKIKYKKFSTILDLHEENAGKNKLNLHKRAQSFTSSKNISKESKQEMMIGVEQWASSTQMKKFNGFQSSLKRQRH